MEEILTTKAGLELTRGAIAGIGGEEEYKEELGL